MEVDLEQFQDPEIGAKLLKKINLFSFFETYMLKKVYQLGCIKTYQKDVTLIVEEEESTGLYILLKGFVGIYKTTKTREGNRFRSQNFRIATLDSGTPFGEMSLIDEGKRSATVMAETPLAVYYLDGDDWNHFLSENPEVALNFYKNSAKLLSKRLRELDTEYISSQQQLWKLALKKRA